MRNNIAFFEKTSSSEVKIMEKINAELIFALNFAQNLTSLLLVSSKEAILFLIYLLADKGKNDFHPPMNLSNSKVFSATLGHQ